MSGDEWEEGDGLLGDDTHVHYPDSDSGRSTGWSGTHTSHEHAKRETSKATERQRMIRSLARNAGASGITVKELREETGWHHGTASGALSNMDKGGLLELIAEKRQRCHIYVLPEFRNGRTLAPRKTVGSGSTAEGRENVAIVELNASLDAATELLELVVSKEPCRYDSDNSCEEHGDLYVPEGEQCFNERIKEFLRNGNSGIV